MINILGNISWMELSTRFKDLNKSTGGEKAVVQKQNVFHQKWENPGVVTEVKLHCQLLSITAKLFCACVMLIVVLNEACYHLA